MMPAGILRQRIQLQSPVETANSFGEMERTWSTYATVWAMIQPLSAREGLIAQQVASTMTHHVRIRYNTEVSTLHRIQWGTRLFDINGIRHVDEARVETVLDCTENPLASA